MKNSKANRIIGRNLRSYRKDARINQVKMGKILGIHQTALCRVENGLQSLTAIQVLRISEQFNINPLSLYEGVK